MLTNQFCIGSKNAEHANMFKFLLYSCRAELNQVNPDTTNHKRQADL